MSNDTTRPQFLKLLGQDMNRASFEGNDRQEGGISGIVRRHEKDQGGAGRSPARAPGPRHQHPPPQIPEAHASQQEQEKIPFLSPEIGDCDCQVQGSEAEEREDDPGEEDEGAAVRITVSVTHADSYRGG